MPKSQQSKPQSSHQLYDVEKILDKKILENKVKYLVKWVGYDLEECTWEPLSNLMPVKDLVDEYEAKHQKSKKKTKIPKTVEILSDTSLNDEKPKKTIKENLFKKTTPSVPIKLSKKKISKREMSPKTPIKTKTKPIIQKMKRKVRGTKEVFEISSSEKHENSIESIHSFKEEEKKISEKKIPESKKIFSKVSSSRHSISKIKMGKRKFSNEKIEKAPTKKIKIDSNTIIEKETKVKETKPLKEKEKEKDQKEIKEIKENDKSVKKNHFLKKSSRKEIKTLKKTRAEPEKSETAENLKEKIEKSLNLIKTNKTFGHFDHGDKAKRIISAKPEKNDVMCAIEWEPREDGFQPVTSHISNSIIKERDPLLLIRFYESKLKFETGKEEKREEKKEKEDKDRIEDKITTDQNEISNHAENKKNMSNEKIQSKSKEKIIKHRDNLNNETPLKTEKKKFESPDKKNANLSHNDNIVKEKSIEKNATITKETKDIFDLEDESDNNEKNKIEIETNLETLKALNILNSDKKLGINRSEEKVCGNNEDDERFELAKEVLESEENNNSKENEESLE